MYLGLGAAFWITKATSVLDIVRGMINAAIEVEFGPHVGDWLMFGATCASAITAAVLGYLAYKNGKRAVKIAEDAEDRENARLKAEADRLTRATRSAVALAMVRAVNAIASNSKTPAETRDLMGRSFGPNLAKATATQEENERVDEALALISLSDENVDQIKFRAWFHHIVHHMRGFSNTSEEDHFDEARDKLFTAITKWNNDSASPHDLIALDFKGPLIIGRVMDVCDGDLSF